MLFAIGLDTVLSNNVPSLNSGKDIFVRRRRALVAILQKATSLYKIDHNLLHSAVIEFLHDCTALSDK